MKENNEVKAVEMPEKITVKPYLTYAQIQQIANEVTRFDTWAERETTIDYMLLSYATDIPDDVAEKIGHETFVLDGTMERIRTEVHNFSKIYDAVTYMESVPRALSQIIEEIPKMMEPLKELEEKYARSKK